MEGIPTHKGTTRFAHGRLRVWLPVALAALALGVPASAAAKPGGSLVNKLAVKACVQQKQDIGNRAFHKRYGAKKPMPNCVKRMRASARRAIGVATVDCQAEVDEWGLEEFLEDWSSFEECVADGAAWELEPDSDDDTEDPEDELL